MKATAETLAILITSSIAMCERLVPNVTGPVCEREFHCLDQEVQLLRGERSKSAKVDPVQQPDQMKERRRAIAVPAFLPGRGTLHRLAVVPAHHATSIRPSRGSGGWRCLGWGLHRPKRQTAP